MSRETIALLGAGGKMGVRLSKNFLKSDYRVRHVEPSPAGRQRLKDELGIECVEHAVVAQHQLVVDELAQRHDLVPVMARQVISGAVAVVCPAGSAVRLSISTCTNRGSPA